MGDWEIKKYKKNEVIFRRGEPADRMYQIRWGSVGIYANYGTEDQLLIVKLEEGGCIGTFAVVDRTGYKETAVALTKDTQLEVISAEHFYEFFTERPAKLLSITASLCNLQRRVMDRYVDACRTIAEMQEEAAMNKEA